MVIADIREQGEGGVNNNWRCILQHIFSKLFFELMKKERMMLNGKTE